MPRMYKKSKAPMSAAASAWVPSQTFGRWPVSAHSNMQRGPLTPRETRLIEYFHRQDVFWKYGEWPRWLQDMALLPHKANPQRYRLFLFFVGNGLDPETAAQWTLVIDARPFNGATRLIQGAYDESAQDHIRQMQREVREETFFKKNFPIMDMTLGRVIKM